MISSRKFLLAILFAFLLAACAPAPAATPSPSAPAAGLCGDGVWDTVEQAHPDACPQDRPATDAAPVPTDEPAAAQQGYLYLTIVSHNEEPTSSRGDFAADAAFYLRNRALVVTLAQELAERGVALNLQSDWNFLQAVAAYDTGSVVDSTGGKNLLRWLVEDMGVEVDAHAHESEYSYADVAYLIEQLGAPDTGVVGGFLFDPPDIASNGWAQFDDGPVAGRIYPDARWQAQILWGAATRGHQEGQDDATAGVWRPQDPFNFYAHDPAQDLIYIGGCTRDEQGVLDLLADLDSGAAPADGFYTAAIFVPQGALSADDIAELTAFIDNLPAEAGGLPVRWANLTEIAASWQSDYGGAAFQYECGG